MPGSFKVNKKNKATILFDLDGTLIDSTEAILESFDESFKVFGIKTPSDNLIKSLIGHPLEIMYDGLGVPEENIQEIIKNYKEHYRKISRKKTILLPYAKEALEEASRFATLGIVTTKTKRYSIELLEHMEILRYFAVLVGREDVQNPKPHAEPILKAMTKLKVKNEDTWMIGDTVMDLQSAKNAEVNCVGVTCGYGERKELESLSENIFSNSLDAVKFILSV